MHAQAVLCRAARRARRIRVLLPYHAKHQRQAPPPPPLLGLPALFLRCVYAPRHGPRSTAVEGGSSPKQLICGVPTPPPKKESCRWLPPVLGSGPAARVEQGVEQVAVFEVGLDDVARALDELPQRAQRHLALHRAALVRDACGEKGPSATDTG